MKKKIYRCSLLLLACTWALSLLGLLSEYHLLFDLASHFKIQYLVGGVVCFICLLLSKAYISTGLSIVLIIGNLAFILPWYISDDVDNSAGNGDITILMNNVLTDNTSPQSLIKLINDKDPDVILLLETNQRWVGYMAEIEREYTQTVIEAREDNFGIALYSKLPIAAADIRHFGHASTPSIVVRLTAKKGDFTLIGTHPLPPMNQRYYHSRNEQLLVLAKEARQLQGPLVVAGDLNTTMWSSHYKVLETVGRLKNTRVGYGVSATWPSFTSALGIPIDHILVSEHFVTARFKVGPDTGSDHRPLITHLRFRSAL